MQLLPGSNIASHACVLTCHTLSTPSPRGKLTLHSVEEACTSATTFMFIMRRHQHPEPRQMVLRPGKTSAAAPCSMPYLSRKRLVHVLLFCVICDGVDGAPPVAELSPDSMLSWLLLQEQQPQVGTPEAHANVIEMILYVIVSRARGR